jgi:hypothetical protein
MKIEYFIILLCSSCALKTNYIPKEYLEPCIVNYSLNKTYGETIIELDNCVYKLNKQMQRLIDIAPKN